MVLFWAVVFIGYFLFRDSLSTTALTLLIWGLVLVGLASLALFFYLHRQLDPKMADYEETDAWFGETKYVHEVRARILALGFFAFVCLAVAFVWWVVP